jgi:hypothetical protein
MRFRKTNETDNEAPFPAWDYRPAYLPDSLKIQVASDTQISEPTYFYLFFAARQASAETKILEPLEHKIPLREVTSATLFVNRKLPLSDAARIIDRTTNVEIKLADENLLELSFDHTTQCKQKDFRPYLPLIIKW